MYRLFGVVNHAGKGPNSGHYYAYVKSCKNRWYEMNDESVQPRHNALAERNAYILLYVQETGESLRRLTAPKCPSHGSMLNARSIPHYEEGEDIGIPAPDKASNATSLRKTLPSGHTNSELVQPSTMSENAVVPDISAHQILFPSEDGLGTNEKETRSKFAANCAPQDSITTAVYLSQCSTSKLDHQSLTISPSKRKGDFFPARHSPSNDRSHNKKFRPYNHSASHSYSHTNPFGRRDQYKDNSNATRLSKENNSFSSCARRPGLHRRMKKRTS
jgi:hypothetical protein